MKPRILLNIVIPAAVLVVAGLVVGLLLASRRQPTERVRQRQAAKVVAPPISPRLDYRMEVVGYGSARPHVQLTITPQVTGIVVAKADNFLSGKYVRKEQVLFRIDPTDYTLSVQRAESRIDLLKAQLARLEQEQKNLTESKEIETGLVKLAEKQLDKVIKLLKANAGSENEVDLARETLLGRKRQLQNILSQLALIGPQRKQLAAEIASAGVELAQAQVNLDRCTIKSPVTGRVLDCFVEVGQLAQAGGNCGQVYGTAVMDVPVSVPAADLKWIDRELLEMCKHGLGPPDRARRIKAKVEWRQGSNGRTITWAGYVERVEAGLEAATRTATLVVRVDNPNPKDPAARLSSPKSGAPVLETNVFCKVTIFGPKLPRVYVLPRSAVLPDGEVYVVAEGRLRKRPVKVARFTGKEALILPGGGISDGDRVVIRPIAKPITNMPVEIIAGAPSVPATAPARP